MTDHPRFERGRGSFEDPHLYYHGGRLVHALFYLIDGTAVRRVRSAVSDLRKPEKPNLVRRLLRQFLRFLVAVLSAPKGDHGGWEGGARGL
jgi:hypothetical protein